MTGGIPGLHADYPEGSWETRSRIWRSFIEHDKHLTRMLGMEVLLPSEEYPDSNGWPHQLYVRTARRMLGRHVMSQRDLARQTKIDDAVGLGYYMVDIYPCRLTVMMDGVLASEGETWELVSPGPYPIAYRSITPMQSECSNLLVPVCNSASHVAYSSIRMEPTYMVLGEAAGIAAAQALREDRSVQEIAVGRLQESLVQVGQILEWNGRGYGPFWGGKRFSAWWEKHPEEYGEDL